MNTNTPQGTAFTLEQLLEVPHGELCAIESRITDKIKEALEALRASGQLPAGSATATAHDAAFAPYAEYVRHASHLLMPLRAARLWFEDLEGLTSEFEKKYGRVHKGAPVFNTGMCFFHAGDYVRAAQYIAEAGKENEQTHGGSSRLHVAEDLAERVLLEPFVAWLEHEFGADYLAATGKPLDANELRGLVKFLAKRDEEAVLFLFAVNRLASQQVGPENESVRLHRVRALGDILLVYESTLRRWQGKKVGQLGARSQKLLERLDSARTPVEWQARNASYKGLEDEEASTLDAVVNGEASAFDRATDKFNRAVCAAYAAYRARNLLMHVLDPKSRLFGDAAFLKRAVGFALIALRLSKFGEDGDWV